QTPADTVHQRHRDALTVRQSRKRIPEAWLHPRLAGVRPLEDGPVLARSGSALTDPVQVTDRVGHRLKLAPVLPRERQRLRGGLATPLRPVRRDQCPPQPRFGYGKERTERRLISRHAAS